MAKAADSTREIPNQYPISIYLNQKYVFNILAMMESGFSQLETIKATRTEQEDRSGKVSGQIGLSNVFAFLGVSLSAERERKRQAGQSEEVTKEKVYTPDSLFAKMRERLYEEGLVRTTNLSERKPGDFVEFNATLSKNPVIETLETLSSLLKTGSIFQQSPQEQNQPKQGGQRRGQQRGPSQTSSLKGDPRLAQLDELLKDLRGDDSGATIDLIGTGVGSKNNQAVLIVDPAYLSDPSLSDLIAGEYTILGKVTKIIREGSLEKINLLRKTSIGNAPGLVEAFVEQMQQLQGLGITVPDLITEIEGPAIQVLPISIFI